MTDWDRLVKALPPPGAAGAVAWPGFESWFGVRLPDDYKRLVDACMKPLVNPVLSARSVSNRAPA